MVNAAVTLEDTLSGTSSASIAVSGDTVSVTTADVNLGLSNLEIDLEQDALTASGDGKASLEVGKGGVMMQIGANEGQNMAVNINSMNANKIGLDSEVASTFSSIADLKGDGVSTTSNSEKAITLIDDAIQEVSSERSKLGAYQNRLDHTINNLGTPSI